MTVITNTTRIGTKFTVQERTIWINRMNGNASTGGPYQLRNDKRAGSPDDWTRMIGFANQFRTTPNSDDYTTYYKGSPTSVFTHGPDNNLGIYDPINSVGTRIACAAMVYQLTGDLSYGTKVKNKLLDIIRGGRLDTYGAINNAAYIFNSVSYPAFDFTNKQRWAPDTMGELNPVFGIAEWGEYLSWAYELTLALYSTAEKAEIISWFTAFIVWAASQVEPTCIRYFRDWANADYRPSTGNLSLQNSPGTLLYYGGPTARKTERLYSNKRATLMSFVGSTAIMCGNQTYIDKAIKFYQEMIMISVWTTGVYTDFVRGMDHNSGTAYDYSTMNQIINFADNLSRNGLFNLYNWTTTKGSVLNSGSVGADKFPISDTDRTSDGTTQKGIHMLCTFQANILNGIGPKYYATSVTTQNGQDAYQIPIPTSSNVKNIILCKPALYYQDPYLEATYKRMAATTGWVDSFTGATHSYGAQSSRNSYPATPQTNGPHNGWQVASMPATLFQFGDLELYVRPYPTSSPGQQAQTLTFAQPAAMAYGDTVDLAAFTSATGLTPTYTITGAGNGTFTGGNFKATRVGSVTVTASQGGNANFMAAVPISRTFIINKRPLVATSSNISRIYNQANPVFNVTYTGFATGEDASVLDTPATPTTAAIIGSVVGTYQITPAGAVDANYSFSYVVGTLTITKGTLSVAITSSLNRLTTDSSFTLAYTIVDSLTGTAVVLTPIFTRTSGTSVTITSGGLVTIVSAGTSVVNLTTPSDPNYYIINNYVRNIDVSLPPAKTAQTITGFNPSLTSPIGTAPETLSATGGASGNPVTFISSDPTIGTCTGTNGATLTRLQVGSFDVIASQLGNGVYQDAPTISRTVVVGKKLLTITVDAKTRAYKDSNPIFTFTISGGYLTGETIASIAVLPTLNANDTTTSVPGTYVISGSGASDDKYAFTYVSGNLVVTKANQTIIADTISDKIQGDPPFTIITTATSQLTPVLTGSGPFTIAGNTITLTGLGACQLLVNQAGDTNYNAAPTITLNFTVLAPVLSPNSITVTSIPTTIVFGDPPFLVAATADSGDPVLISLVSGPATGTNPYTITGAGTLRFLFTEDGNTTHVAAIDTYRDVIVNKKSQSITFASIPDRLISNNPLSVTATTTAAGQVVLFKSDLANGVLSQPVAGEGSFVQNVAGLASVTAYVDDSANYTGASVTQLFTVLNAPPTGVIDVLDTFDVSLIKFGYNPYLVNRSEYYMEFDGIGTVVHNRIIINFRTFNAIKAFTIEDWDGLAWAIIKTEIANTKQVYDITYTTRTAYGKLRVVAVGKSLKTNVVKTSLMGVVS